MAEDLSEKRCVPCEGGVEPLAGETLEGYLAQLASGWRVVDDHHLERRYELPDFRSALQLVECIAELAEQEGHHPDIRFGWGYVEVQIWTHAIGGLSENDFVLAAKIDRHCRS